MDELRAIADRTVFVYAVEGPTVTSEADAVDLIGALWGLDAEWLALPTSRLSPAFLDLSSGVAGAIIQKFVTYGLRLALVGDIETALAGSAALRDFVRETNAGERVWFVPDLEGLKARLEARSEA